MVVRLHGQRPLSLAASWNRAAAATGYWQIPGSRFDRGSQLDTLVAVVQQAPAPFLRAGRLGPVIEGLLAKEPQRRLTLDEARAALHAVQRGELTMGVRVGE